MLLSFLTESGLDSFESDTCIGEIMSSLNSKWVLLIDSLTLDTLGKMWPKETQDGGDIRYSFFISAHLIGV